MEKKRFSSVTSTNTQNLLLQVTNALINTTGNCAASAVSVFSF